MFGWYISQFTCHWQMGQKVNSGFLAPTVRHHGLQQASKHQMAEICMMNAAGLFIIASGSLSQCNYHPANVCSSHGSKEERP